MPPQTRLRMLTVIAVSGCAAASYCTGGPSGGKPNMLPIEELNLSAPVFYNLSALQWAIRVDNTTFPVLHLSGNGYQMGFAQGTLLRDRCIAMWDAFWAYLVLEAGGERAVAAALLPVQRASARHIPNQFTEELRGLAASTGYNYTKILWLHLYPETAGGHCSMFGGWGSATHDSYSGGLLQMRALDYITAPFLTDNHAILVSHPDDGRNAVVNIGFIGTITMVTGVSSARMALSQIGVSNPDSTFGPQRNGHGIPFNFLLRDLMESKNSIPEIQRGLQAADRTVDLILGFGSGGDEAQAHPFTGVQYAADQVRFYEDWNMLPVNQSWHPMIENVVYHGMDWDCPAWTSLLGKQITSFHGNLTAEAAIRYINPIVQTGSLHVAVYEVASQVFYLSHSRPSGAGGDAIPAYSSPYIRVDAAALMRRLTPVSTAYCGG